MVDSTSGPPIAAPTPICLRSGDSLNTTATKVTTLSGRAVPMAARTVPTATVPTWSRAPSHSTALTNHSHAR